MLLGFKNFARLANTPATKGEMQISVANENLLKSVISNFCRGRQKQSFHTCMPRMKRDKDLEIRQATKQARSKENLPPGNLDFVPKRQDIIPSYDLLSRLFDGVPFKDVPIIVISSSRNNTHLSLSDKGLTKVYRTCGMEGFKNARKGTNIAGQTTGVSVALRALKKGYKTIRVVFRGLGPGRLSSLKGLQMGGMNIISVTDDTTDSSHLRPRKRRRL